MGERGRYHATVFLMARRGLELLMGGEMTMWPPFSLRNESAEMVAYLGRCHRIIFFSSNESADMVDRVVRCHSNGSKRRLAVLLTKHAMD